MMMQPNIDEEGEVAGLIQVADIPADRLEYGVTQSPYLTIHWYSKSKTAILPQEKRILRDMVMNTK